MTKKQYNLFFIIACIAAFSVPCILYVQTLLNQPPLISPIPPVVARVKTANGDYLLTKYTKQGKCILFMDGAGTNRKFCDGYTLIDLQVSPSYAIGSEAHP